MRRSAIPPLCLLALAYGAAALATESPSSSRARTEPSPQRPASPEEQRRLDFASRDLELRIERSGSLYGKPELDAYLQSVAEKLLRTEREPVGSPVRVRAIRDAASNAFALPNGAVFITTGLLHRLGSEAQLACVLGHELTHFTSAHALKQQRSAARKTTWSRSLGILFAAAVGAATNDPQAASAAAGLSQDVGQLWLLASVSGYSRDLEREADRHGMRRLVAAGYDAPEGAKVFEHLLQAARDEGGEATPYFSSHPRLEERLASYYELLAGEFAGVAGTSDFAGAEEYRSQIHGLTLDQVEILIAANEFDRAARLLEAEIAADGSARAHYLAGELARRSSNGESQELALAAYDRAIAHADAPADAYRQKAMIHRMRGEHGSAVEAFSRYLVLAPHAVDAPLVRLYLQEQGADPPTETPAGGTP